MEIGREVKSVDFTTGPKFLLCWFFFCLTLRILAALTDWKKVNPRPDFSIFPFAIIKKRFHQIHIMSLIDTLYASLSEPYLYPAMAQDLLDSEGSDGKAAARDFTANCIALARRKDASENGSPSIGNERKNQRIPLLEWLINIVQTRGEYSVGFFGRSVYGGAGCDTSDVECVLFLQDRDSGLEYRLSPRPKEATILKVYDSIFSLPNFPEQDLAYLFAGPVMLYPSAPNPFAIRRIESVRQKYYGADGEAGLMKRITHAASKVLNRQELSLFESNATASRFIGRSLTARDAIMYVDFGERPDLSSVHMAYENQLRAMNEEDLAALAKAAMKRIKVKEEHCGRLAKKYADRLMGRK